jgi:hypothetical protein
MRLTAPLALATAFAAVLAPTSSALAAAPRFESFVMTFHTFDGVDQPTHVSATGPIQGAGVETQTETQTPQGELVSFTWHLRNGDVNLEAVEDYSMTVDLQACTAKATGTGSWVITGGTGDFVNASGSGTFSDHGQFTGARDHGSCDIEAMPRTSVFTLAGSGTASLGG